MKRILLAIYQLFIWFPLFLLITLITAITVFLGSMLFGTKFFTYQVGAWWSQLTCIISLCPVTVKGRDKLDKNQSYVFIANHQGAFDIFLIFGYIGQPIKWVMKQSLRKIPLIGAACEAAGFIFVDNSSARAAAQTIKQAEERLTDGNSVAIFPEGSRSQTGKLGRFKKGAYQMALDLKLPIVPITLNGPFEVMPIGSLLLKPHRLELIIHDPIPTQDIVITDMRDAAVKIGALMEESKAEIEFGLWGRYK